jgi:hypothetical protein
MTLTNGDIWRAHAERLGIPRTSIWKAQEGLARDKKKGDGTDVAMARLMLRHGRLTDEARAWVAREYPQ